MYLHHSGKHLYASQEGSLQTAYLATVWINSHAKDKRPMPTFETWLGKKYGMSGEATEQRRVVYSPLVTRGVRYLISRELLSNRVFARLNYQALVASGLEDERGATTRQP